MKDRLKVVVLCGGRSGEHDVSLMSAASVISALDPSKYDVECVGITRSGRWLAGKDVLRQLGDGADVQDKGDALTLPGLQAVVADSRAGDARSSRPDVVIPILHGPMGEDGTVQGLLELAEIPYVGGGVLASAVGMDKVVMKQLFAQHGLPLVDYAVVLRKRWVADRESCSTMVAAQVGFPCFVKPACLGSSVGISKAHDIGELALAMDLASTYDRKIVVEKAVEGCREVECAVLGNDDPIASIPGEIRPSHEFYDYEDKYLDDGAQLIVPARVSEDVAADVQSLAIRAFKSIDCCGMARVDFFLTVDDEVIVNEINTIPGFTKISMYPRLWEASGLPMTQLVDKLIELALERHSERLACRNTYR